MRSTPSAGANGKTGFDGGAYLDTLLSPGVFPVHTNHNNDFDFCAADNDNCVGGNAKDALPQGLTDTLFIDSPTPVSRARPNTPFIF